MDDARILALVAAQGVGQERLEDRASSETIRRLAVVTDWYDHQQITDAAIAAGGVVRAASQSSAALTDAYLTRVLAEMLGRGVRAAGVIDTSKPLRDGIERYDQVYGRVADTIRYQVSLGTTPDEALRIGMDRADSMVRTDLSLARRDQVGRSLAGRSGVTGYRRVIHPEFSKTGTCGLCIAAADRIYHREQLMPLHGRCKCTVAPVTDSLDPGGTLNDSDLAAVYASSTSTKAADLKRVRYQVQEHSELGPTLVDSRHAFRGQDAVLPAA